VTSRSKRPSLNYAEWCHRVGGAAGKHGTRIAFGPDTHAAWLRGVTPNAFAKSAPRSKLADAPRAPRGGSRSSSARASSRRDAGLRECGEASLHEPLLAIAEGGVFGMGACPERALTKSTRNVALSVVQFDRFVARAGGGGELVREADVPIDGKAWVSGKVCLPWVRVTRDPKNFRACAARARELGRMESSSAIFKLLQPTLVKEDQEVFLAVLLDNQMRLRAISEIARGGRASVNPSIPDVLRVALVEGSTAVVVAHNHPSGEVEPSPQDRSFTVALAQAFQSVGVPLLDHVVVGPSKYWSFSDHGLLPMMKG
jgi:hypothetical protein